ncbi:superoxide dismutase [Cu-Zn]-like [Ixodes scapularis]|uniref:superoxide dismutase [Cu-Zn]-like n=1 Tax=Ixodes scapularis TaxID=6945 RepID=UPI001C39463A|nr:superoxide dismutase [Cu-Zn]-like [Ixodes scapularis]
MELSWATTTALLVFLAVAARGGGAAPSLFDLAEDRYLKDEDVTDAICKLTQPAGGNLTGMLSFQQNDPEDLVTIIGDISGLSPGFHGFHIHMKGDLTNGCESTGHHFDVGRGMWHGARQDVVRHVGDLGNVEADARGDAQFVIFDRLLSLNGPNSIVGRSAIIHKQEDDLGLGGTIESRETGRSGPIIACGVIGIAQPRA